MRSEGQEESGSEGGIPEEAGLRGSRWGRRADLAVRSLVTFSRAPFEKCRS